MKKSNLQAGDIAQLVECLLVEKQVQSPAPHKLGLVACACNPSTQKWGGRWSQGYPVLLLLASSRPAWVI